MAMKNPFIIKMPVLLDAKIRWRVFRTFLARRNVALPMFIGGTVAIASTVLILTSAGTPINLEVFAAEVHAAQRHEQALATTDIYHLKWTITEGADKARYVQTRFPEAAITTPRNDSLETFQHNENRLTHIHSNDGAFGFEVFLSNATTNTLTLYHYGEDKKAPSPARTEYDAVHDIRSLYQSFTSLETPVVPTLPPNATLIDIDEKKHVAIFSSSPATNVTVHHHIDTNTKLLTKEVVYISDEKQNTYEMAQITYNERSIIPAEEFAGIFNATQYNFAIIDTKQIAPSPISQWRQNSSIALAL